MRNGLPETTSSLLHRSYSLCSWTQNAASLDSLDCDDTFACVYASEFFGTRRTISWEAMSNKPSGISSDLGTYTIMCQTTTAANQQRDTANEAILTHYSHTLCGGRARMVRSRNTTLMNACKRRSLSEWVCNWEKKNNLVTIVNRIWFLSYN